MKQIDENNFLTGITPLVPMTPEEARILQAPFHNGAYSGLLKSKGSPPDKMENGKPVYKDGKVVADWNAPKSAWKFRYYEVGYNGMAGINRINSVFPGRWGVMPHDLDVRELPYITITWVDKVQTEVQKTAISVSLDVDLYFDGRLICTQPGGHVLKGDNIGAVDIGMARKSAVTDATKRLLFVVFGIGWEFYLGAVSEEDCVKAIQDAETDPFGIPKLKIPKGFTCWDGYSNQVSDVQAETEAQKETHQVENQKPVNRNGDSAVYIQADKLRVEMLTEALGWQLKQVEKHYKNVPLVMWDAEETMDAVTRLENKIQSLVDKKKMQLPTGLCKKCTRTLPLLNADTIIVFPGVCTDCYDESEVPEE